MNKNLRLSQIIGFSPRRKTYRYRNRATHHRVCFDYNFSGYEFKEPNLREKIIEYIFPSRFESLILQNKNIFNKIKLYE